MRYTRYNHKRKGDSGIMKFIVSLIITVVAAGAIGIGLAKVIFEIVPINNLNMGIEDEAQVVSGQNNNDNKTVVSGNTAFSLIQCGYFSSKENATDALQKLSSVNSSFIAEDNGKFRVVAGIYDSNSAQKIIEELKAKGIESMKVSINLNPDDELQSQIAAISDGYLQILNATFSENVKSVNTKEFKEWASKLEDVKGVDGSEMLQALKTYISQLPEEIKKEDVSKEMDYLYDILIKYKQN